MTDRSARRVARLLAQLLTRADSGRARQLPVSSVTLDDGTAQGIIDTATQATDAHTLSEVQAGQLDDLGQITDTSAIDATFLPERIAGADASADAGYATGVAAWEIARTAQAGVQNALDQAAQAIQQAANALTTSNGKNARRRGQTQPTEPPGGWTAGDQWIVDNADGVPSEVRVWNGTAFVFEQILAAELLVVSGGGKVRLADGVVTADAIAADAIDGMIITGATIIQRGSSPAAGTYPHPMTATTVGWMSMGVGTVTTAAHTQAGHTSTRKLVVTPASANAAAAWAVPNIYTGARIRIMVAVRRATAGKVWLNGMAVPTDGTTIAANTWVTIQSAEFTAAGGVWVSVGALDGSIEITEPRVVVVSTGETTATLATDPVQGPSLMWRARDVTTGVYRSDGIALRMVNAVQGGTFLYAADPTGISFLSESVPNPLAYVRSIDTDSNLDVKSTGWTRFTSSELVHARDQPWRRATSVTGPWNFYIELRNGWANQINANWDGLMSCRRMGIAYLTGAITKSAAYGALEVIGLLPPPLRPEIPCLIPAAYGQSGGYVLVRTNGEIVTASSGTGGQIALGGSLTPNWNY